MLKRFLNSLLLISFLTVFSIDSISPLFEADNGVFCELADANNNEDSNEEELSRTEAEAILVHVPKIEPRFCFIDNKNRENNFSIANSYTLKIPTPPPEHNS